MPTDDSARNRRLVRPATGWGVLLVGVALAMLTGLGIVALHDRAESDLGQAVLLARIDGLVHRLRPLEGIAKDPPATQSDTSAREWAEELDELLTEARAELEIVLAELDRLDSDLALEVRVATERYITTTEELARLVAAGEDDFGTGYSSLAYLHRLPIDVLKIDRSFVSRLGEGIEGTAIVRTIVGLAKTVGLVVVGEGVETAEQLAQLRALGSDRGQGYLFSRPVPADEVCGLLTAGVEWSIDAGTERQPVAVPSATG